MPVRAGQSYTATVDKAYLGASQEKGTPAIYFTFDTPDGSIDYAAWITEGTKERVAETMQKCFGVTIEQLRDQSYLDNLDNELSGMKVYITTAEEEYNGKSRVKVQWLNPDKKNKGVNVVSRVVTLFGGKPSQVTVPDDDVPF